MGGTVGKPVDRVPEVPVGNGDEVVQRALERRTRRDEADQISILRRSSTLQARPSISNPTTFNTPIAKTLHLPLWHDADATFLTPLPAAQLDAMALKPSLSADQRAAHATWENIYTPSHPYTPFTPYLPSHDGGSAGLVKLEQGIGANCSVVAGLNALVAHNARYGTTLGMRNFVPITVKRRKGEDVDEGEVRYWRVKVFFNGTWRSVSSLHFVRICTDTRTARHRFTSTRLTRPLETPPRNNLSTQLLTSYNNQQSPLALPPRESLHVPHRILRLPRLNTSVRPTRPDIVDTGTNRPLRRRVSQGTDVGSSGGGVAEGYGVGHTRNGRGGWEERGEGCTLGSTARVRRCGHPLRFRCASRQRRGGSKGEDDEGFESLEERSDADGRRACVDEGYVGVVSGGNGRRGSGGTAGCVKVSFWYVCVTDQLGQICGG